MNPTPPETAEPLDRVVARFAELYPDEVAASLERFESDEIPPVLTSLGPREAAAVLSRLNSQIGADAFQALPPEYRADVLELMDPPRGVALLSRLAEGVRDETLEAVRTGTRRELSALLKYPVDSAGRLMDPMVVTLRAETTVEQALERVRGLFPRRIFDAFLVDGNGVLAGSAALQDIATAPSGTTLGTITRKDPPRVRDTAGRAEISEVLEERPANSLPVVDFEGRVVGVIRHAELLDTVERDATADIQSMVGAGREERALSPVLFVVKKRLPWLQVNLGTAFLAASVVGLFEGTIARFTALAVLLPVVAGQSGNTGAQALAVVMRGLALREIAPRHWFKVVSKEALVGMANGIAVALLTSGAVWVWSDSSGLALVIGVAMVLSMSMAAMAGAVIPILLQSIGQDPAQSSSIILTTVTDIVGFFSFLGLATVFASIL